VKLVEFVHLIFKQADSLADSRHPQPRPDGPPSRAHRPAGAGTAAKTWPQPQFPSTAANRS